MKLHSKRIYDSKNRLIYELHNNTDETINKYDDNSNLIYSKNWNIKTGEIFYEFSQEFDSNNRLIHLIDYEYKVDRKYIYNSDDTIESIITDEDGISKEIIDIDEICIAEVEEPNKKSKIIDEFGNVSLYEYDINNNVSKIIDLSEDGIPILEIDYENIYRG